MMVRAHVRVALANSRGGRTRSHASKQRSACAMFTPESDPYSFSLHALRRTLRLSALATATR
eukprot:6181511-Pleurochrysis_carterae.AAC.2